MQNLARVLGLVAVANVVLLASAAAQPGDDGRDAFAANRRLGRGINLGNALEAPREGAWGLTLQVEHFERIKQAGFAAVRIPICRNYCCNMLTSRCGNKRNCRARGSKNWCSTGASNWRVWRR